MNAAVLVTFLALVAGLVCEVLYLERELLKARRTALKLCNQSLALAKAMSVVLDLLQDKPVEVHMSAGSMN